jgi:hypothetical protein
LRTWQKPTWCFFALTEKLGIGREGYRQIIETIMADVIEMYKANMPPEYCNE